MVEIRQYYEGYLEYLRHSGDVSLEEGEIYLGFYNMELTLILIQFPETVSEELESKKDEIAKLTVIVQELESKALDVMKTNETLKEEYVSFVIISDSFSTKDKNYRMSHKSLPRN